LQATSLETLKHMVALGDGYSLLPVMAAERGLTRLVRCRPFAGAVPGRTIALAWRASVAADADYRQLAAALRDAAPPSVRPLAES
jgi:LysR family hydrogen peroxide-inducible transcriptional activator